MLTVIDALPGTMKLPRDISVLDAQRVELFPRVVIARAWLNAGAFGKFPVMNAVASSPTANSPPSTAIGAVWW
jgi:hypothetical protein